MLGTDPVELKPVGSLVFGDFRILFALFVDTMVLVTNVS
jgi:hypothetical protein